MNNIITKTHWKKVDYRFESLQLTINALGKTIIKLNEKLNEIDFYDGTWYIEEVEPIIGLSFICLQNYINSSIYDRFETLENQYEKYKLGKIIRETRRTDIELIVGLANYFKHRDSDKKLHNKTENILIDCNLQFDKEIDIKNSPIIKGLEYFSENLKLTPLIEIVTNWREKIWVMQ